MKSAPYLGVDIFSLTPLISHFTSSRPAKFRSVPSCLMAASHFSRLLSSSSCSHNSLHASCRIQVCALLPHDSLTVLTTALLIQLFAQLSSRILQDPGLCPPASRLTYSPHDCSPHPVVRTTLFTRLAEFRSVPSCLTTHSQSSRLLSSSSCLHNSLHASGRIQVCAFLPLDSLTSQVRSRPK